MKRTLILTGESGAGKSSALKYLEDLGFYCIDNIPPDLIPSFLSLIESNPEVEKSALVVDVRNPAFRTSAPEMLRRIKGAFPEAEIWHFTASKETLLKRFKETRRPHPFQRYFPGRNLEELIKNEQAFYEGLRGLVDRVIDTTNLTPHDLKRSIRQILSVGKPQLQVTVMSFGFKYGVPSGADNVFDVRFLPNPHFVPGLKLKTGLDRDVRDYVLSFPETLETIERIYSFISHTLPLYEKEGKAYITYAVGCTGGQHRSVVVAEEIAKRLSGEFSDYSIFVEHREQNVRRKVKGS
ncbi:MAG: RNase adapter RapZ [Desulfurobacteriaceae bacterium]